MIQHHPYYIVAPRYTRTSAGVRVLYRLAGLLNSRGFPAFIFLSPNFGEGASCSPMDVAPFLFRRIVDYHYSVGICPIIIYPEVTSVDRYSPPVKVQYVLNYYGLLSQASDHCNDDYFLAYSEKISEGLPAGVPSSNLFIPVSDPLFYCSDTAVVSRRGGVVYAGKFKYRFGGKTFPLTDGMPEITRDRPDSQTPEQIRGLFQTAEFFYCYEDSALAIEAILCGCPTVFLPNDYFPGPLGAKELGGLGFAVGTSAEQLAHAEATVGAARAHYLRLPENLGPQLDLFIKATQKLAAGRPYTKPFAEGYLRPPGLLQRTLDTSRFMRDVIEDRGWGGTAGLIAKRIRAGRFKV